MAHNIHPDQCVLAGMTHEYSLQGELRGCLFPHTGNEALTSAKLSSQFSMRTPSSNSVALKRSPVCVCVCVCVCAYVCVWMGLPLCHLMCVCVCACKNQWDQTLYKPFFQEVILSWAKTSWIQYSNLTAICMYSLYSCALYPQHISSLAAHHL